MTERLDTEVAIVGGGIIGSSAALFLRQMGLSVTLLEGDRCGSKASGATFGGLRRQGRPLEELPLAQRAHELWGQLPSLIGIDGEYIRSGHMKLARSEADLRSLIAYRDRTADFGLDLRIVEGAAFRAAYPYFGDCAVGGSLCPDDGHANPRLVSPAFARAAAEAGADIREQTPVDRIERDGGGFLLFSGEKLTVRASLLINAAGAWAGSIAAQFGEPVPLTPGYPCMAVTEPLPLFLSVNVGVEGGGVYGRQVERGNVVIGGGRGVASGDGFARPERGAVITLMRQAADLFSALRGANVIRFWSGVEGFTADQRPIIGPSATTSGLYHAFGFSGAGFQIGPAVGEALAKLIRNGRSPVPLDAFSIGRFGRAA